MNTVNKNILLLICGVCFTFLFLLQPYARMEPPKSTDRVTITSLNKFITPADIGKGVKKSKGNVAPVIISHNKHDLAKLKCVTCHHKKGNDDRIKQCAVCHKGSEGEDTMHGLCITCHTEKNKGPTECNACHVPPAKKS